MVALSFIARIVVANHSPRIGSQDTRSFFISEKAEENTSCEKTKLTRKMRKKSRVVLFIILVLRILNKNLANFSY
jgi:hypothetical protein